MMSLSFLQLFLGVAALLTLPTSNAFAPSASGYNAIRSRTLAPLVQQQQELESSKLEFSKTTGHCSKNHHHQNAFSSLSAHRIKTLFRSSETTTRTETSSSPTSTRTVAAPAPTTSSNNRNLPGKTLVTSATKNAVQYLAIATTMVKQTSSNLYYNGLSDVLSGLRSTVLKYWWIHPLFLALVPLLTNFVLRTGDAAMPHFWPVTRMDHILASPDAALVIGFFLWSNIAYFVSGAYLVKKFPPVLKSTSSTNSDNNNASSLSAASLVLSKVKQMTQLVPTQQTWLGLLLLAAGLISTIFHTEQALGSYAIANSLCYLDHALAGTSCFYYFHVCNAPSKKVWALGIAGLAALSIPLPGYAWLHSLWHFLSASAAVLWALESFAQQPQQPDMTMPYLQTGSSAVIHTPATTETGES